MGWALRELNGGELTELTADGQSSRVGLAIQPVKVIFSGRVAAPLPSSNDRVVQVIFSDGPAWASILPDMTCFVGSSSGAYDVGMVRVRKAATSSILYVSECSDVAWAVGQYLTVIEDFGIWARHLRITGTDPFVVYMDWDVAYDGHHLTCDPVPVLGPHVVKKLAGATVQVTGFDAGDSWVRGSTITGYSWAAPGASATAGMATATPTLTYNAAGWYRVSCQVTAENGRFFTGYRYVYVYDSTHPPAWAMDVSGCEGDTGRGGWSFRATAHADATLAEVRNRALVILFAEDVYGSTEGSVGIVKDRENILAIGWIVGESITHDPVHGTVEFVVEGAHSLIGKVTGFPSGVKDVGPAVPATWLEMQNMKVEDALWHFLHWRSTCTRMMDIFPPGTNVPIGLANSGLSTLWQQVQEIAVQTIKAPPLCDRYGRLYVQTNSQFIPVADRAGIPIILAIQSNYWRDSVQIERVVVPPVGRVDQAGVAWSNAIQKGTPLFSLAPGHVMKQYGGVQAEDRLALTGQAQANLLAGLILGNALNPYPSMLVRFAMNLRALDICPWQYATVTLAADENPRGIVLTNFKIIPRRVSLSYQGGEDGGVLLTDVDFEGYTTETSSCDGDIPATPPDPAPPPDPPLPPDPPAPPGVPPPDTMLLHDRINIVLTEDFQSANPTWRSVRGGTLTGIIFTVKLDVFDGQGAWAVTGTEGGLGGDTGAGVGVWRCDDIFAPAPDWRLIFSQADAYNQRAAVLNCGTYSFGDGSWQLRSLIPTGAGMAETAGVTWHGIGFSETGSRMGSMFFRLSPYGGFAYKSQANCSFCNSSKCPPPGEQERMCHANVGYCASALIINQYNLYGCHQLYSDGGLVYGAGVELEIFGDMYCYLRIGFCPGPALPCPGAGAYRRKAWVPAGRLTAGDYFLNGARHAVFSGGQIYATTEDSSVGAGGGGALWTGEGALVEDNVFDHYSFVGLTAGNDGLYWCRYTGRDEQANGVKRDGAWLGIYSEELFGASGWGFTEGRIGYIGAVPMDGGDGLVIMRKDQPHIGQINKQIVYWWTAAGGVQDKTGNLVSIVTTWRGTGGTTGAWGYNIDNVGASCLVELLP